MTGNGIYTADNTWVDWNNAYSSAYDTTGYTLTSNSVRLHKVQWQAWNAGTIATTNDYTWKTWAQGTNSYAYTRRIVTPYVDTRSPEQIAADQAAAAVRAEERRIAAEARRQEAAFAQERAEELLTAHLTPEQLAEWKEKEQIHVVSPRGRRYCIRKGRAHNVFEVDQRGRRVKELCGHVSESVPNADNVLAQKLAIELMEEQFLATCNVWDLTIPGRPLINRSRGPLVAA